MSYRFQAGLAELQDRWGWYFALGLALVILGVAASSWAYLTTVASVFVFGWFLLCAGVTLGILSVMTKRWSGFLLSLSAGILSAITGVLLLRAPLAGATSLTLVIASFLLFSGIFRISSSIAMRFPQWGWSFASGMVSIGLGAILIASWPAIGLWFLGFYIGLDLIAHGIAWCMFALSIRSLAHEIDVVRERPAA